MLTFGVPSVRVVPPEAGGRLVGLIAPVTVQSDGEKTAMTFTARHAIWFV